jgi:hypothetical protein
LADVRELDRAWRAWHHVTLIVGVAGEEGEDLVASEQPVNEAEEPLRR